MCVINTNIELTELIKWPEVCVCVCVCDWGWVWCSGDSEVSHWCPVSTFSRCRRLSVLRLAARRRGAKFTVCWKCHL